MTVHATHRLDGLEPDNLLAFMALLGLLRTLEEARPDWHPRVSWTVDEPPLRPRLHAAEEVAGDAIVEAAAEGLAALARHHDFQGAAGLEAATRRGCTETSGRSWFGPIHGRFMGRSHQ